MHTNQKLNSMRRPEMDAEFMVSVLMEVDGNKRQRVGSIELNPLELCIMMENQCGKLGFRLLPSSKQARATEIPLISHENFPNIILKTRAVLIENFREMVASTGKGSDQGSGMVHNEDTSEKLLNDAMDAHEDFVHHGNLVSLEQEISHLRTAMEVVPEDDPRLSAITNNLAGALIHRFEEFGHQADIDEAIRIFQVTTSLIPDDHKAKPNHLGNLGTALTTRFMHFGNIDDLEKSIVQNQMAVNLSPDDHPQKPLFLDNLGTSLHLRFERFGDITDIDNAVARKRAAVNLSPDVSKPSVLSSLGISLDARFDRFGDIADIDGAIACHQKAINSMPDDHPKKFHYFNRLGMSFDVRFERLGNASDLEHAIIQHQRAANSIPNFHPDKPKVLHNFGASLISRFTKFGNTADLDAAISKYQEAVDLTPDNDPNRSFYLTNLGGSLRERFKKLGNPTDIDNAIRKQQMAIELIPAGHPGKPNSLNHLGNSFMARFGRLGNAIDIEHAIKQYQQAVDTMETGHPDRLLFLINLGNTLLVRFQQFGQLHDVKMAALHLSTAATSTVGPPHIRFGAAEDWISIAPLVDPESILSAYECALGLMPLVAWLGLPIADRHHHLVKIGGIARDAAAAAISFEQYDKALEWLEQGRSIVWTQILQLRTPVDRLRDVNPGLADQLLQVSRLLDRGSRKDGISQLEDASIEEQGRKYRALTAEWESLIKQVRSLPDFEDFLRPPSASRLKGASRHGPVVILNIAKERCDALALLPGLEEVIHIPLPNMSSQRVTELRDELKDQLYSNGIRMGDTRAAVKVTDEDDNETCKRVLAELWNDLVKHVMDSLAFSVRSL
jgi:tetratricopeptide (TPR) repeat protein